MKKQGKGVSRMQATVLPFKPLVRAKKTDKASKTRTPKRFDWITDADMEEINEVDSRGRGYDYTDHRREE
jgi:hypothetical protein